MKPKEDRSASHPARRTRRGEQSADTLKELPPLHPQQIERVHAAVHRALEGCDFKSPDEANEFLQEQLAAGAFDWDKIGPAADATPLDRAQEILYEALDAPSRGKRVKMATKALAISEHCADAWLLLAKEQAKTAAETLEYIRKAVEAGEGALGPEVFEQNRGYFWGVPETRPYMRAREMLADALAMSGQMDEAVTHWEEMLELNPNDNQGIRMRLSLAYLESGAHDKAAALFERYPDDASCEMLYDRVIHLLAIGDRPAARSAFRNAIRSNRHLPDFLLGRRQFPEEIPDHITWGGEDEAAFYALDHQSLWQNTPGALDLLRAAPVRWH